MTADPGLTDAEADVARRWFLGEATEDELSEVIRAHVERIAQVRVTSPATFTTTNTHQEQQ